jgi:hypothetical protein
MPASLAAAFTDTVFAVRQALSAPTWENPSVIGLLCANAPVPAASANAAPTIVRNAIFLTSFMYCLPMYEFLVAIFRGSRELHCLPYFSDGRHHFRAPPVLYPFVRSGAVRIADRTDTSAKTQIFRFPLVSLDLNFRVTLGSTESMEKGDNSPMKNWPYQIYFSALV